MDIENSIESTMNEIVAGADSASAGSSVSPSSASSAEPWRSRPQSWKADYEAHWAKLPPEVQQYIHEREKQALDGITKYKAVADKWDRTLQPYKQWIDALQLDPTDVVDRLARAHIILKYGDPTDKAKYAKELLDSYQLWDLVGQQPPPVNQELESVKQTVHALAREIQERAYRESLDQVNKFFSDPKNEFAGELQDDILKLLQRANGQLTLQEAYEQAMWLNPAVRAKLMQREIEKTATPARKGPVNVVPSSAPVTQTADESETIDDTLKSTLAVLKRRA